MTTCLLESLRPVTNTGHARSHQQPWMSLPLPNLKPHVHVRAAGEGQLSGHSCRSPSPETAPSPAPVLALLQGGCRKEEAVAGTAACPLTTAGGSSKAHTDSPPRPGGGEPHAGQGRPGQEACVGLSPGFTAALADPVSGPPSGKLLSLVSS